MSDFQTKLNKIAAQVIFRPTLKSAHNYVNIASTFEADYEEWVELESKQYALYKPQDLTGLLFGNSSVAAIDEGKSQDQSKLLEMLLKGLNHYYGETEVKVIRRAGFALVKVLEAPFDFDDLAELIFRKFYSSAPIFQDISFETKPRDVVFILDGEKDGLFNHVEIGPVTSKEATKRFNSNFTRKEKVVLGESNLFIAVDVFSNKETTLGSFSEMEEIVQNCQTKANELFESYLEYIIN